MTDCLGCREVAGAIELPGGLLVDEPLVLAFHVPPAVVPEPFLGHLVIVTRRHVDHLGDLEDAEAEAVGRWARRLAAALRRVPGVARVHAGVHGLGDPHFHLHVIPRYVGTPVGLGPFEVDEWEGAPHGGAPQIERLVGRLRQALATQSTRRSSPAA